MKKTFKTEQGITLIALIITVVVMLILAGVAISVLVDGDGLFNQTRAAAEEYKTAAEEEAAIVSDLIAEIDQYLSGVPSNPGGDDEGETTPDTTAPTVATLEVTEKSTTEFTLKATGQDETGIVKYEFYVDDMTTPYKTVESTENIATCEVIERTAATTYQCKVIVYDAANNSKPSEEINVTTNNGVIPNDIAVVGDFVNYSVDVDVNGNGTIDEGETFDKWRILNFDNNGHMEIVCYNGPAYTLGAGNDSKVTTDTVILNEAKNDFITAIQQLNTASVPYKGGRFGYNARHLGSDPTSPDNYAELSSIAQTYIKYLGAATIPTELTNEGINDNVYEIDKSAIETFSGDKKLSGENGTDEHIWLASRFLSSGGANSNYYVRILDPLGSPSYNRLYYVSVGGQLAAGGYDCALAPVVSLESGIKIDKNAEGNGSKESPWVLIN